MLPARCAAANSAASRVSRICAPTRLQCKHGVERQRVHLARQRFVQRRPLFAVQHGVIGEVGRSFRLIGGHHLNECFLAHGLQRVVRAALFAQRGYRFLAERFPAERARAVRRIHQALVRQRQQLRVQRIEEHAAKFGGRPAQRRAQIGPAYVADEQSVAGEHGMRLRIAGVQVVNDDGDRFRSVARRFQHLQAHASEFENVAIAKRSKRVRRFRRGAQIDCCAHAIAQLQMPGDKIGVEMRQEYVLDLERVLGGKRNVLVGVALRVNDGCRACLPRLQ